MFSCVLAFQCLLLVFPINETQILVLGMEDGIMVYVGMDATETTT